MSIYYLRYGLNLLEAAAHHEPLNGLGIWGNMRLCLGTPSKAKQYYRTPENLGALVLASIRGWFMRSRPLAKQQFSKKKAL